ncbi:MAG: hypothetical protein ABIX01_23540 [Chitinophagaceae bacterium]
MKNCFRVLLLCCSSAFAFAQPVTFTPLPDAPMGKALCFAYNSATNRLWVCTASKVFYSDNNGTSWVNTTATGVSSPSAIALTTTGIPYIITPQNGMRHYNGASWIADNTGLPTNPMPQFTSIAIDVAGNVYAGAGWHGLPPNYSGVWKWNGSTWAAMNNGLPTVPVSPSPEITSLVLDAAGVLYAGTAKVLLNGGGQGFGVYRWSGSSWGSFGTGLGNLNVTSLAINSANELFAGTFNSIAHISATNAGIWTNSTTGLPTVATTVRCISFDALNNIYAGVGYLPEQAGTLFGSVYMSGNSGSTWTQSSALANITTSINGIVTDNAGNIFAGATGIYKSTNQGTSWALDTVGITKNRARGGYIAINSLGHIYAAGEGGISKSTDAGATWQLIINGIDRHDLTCIAIDKNDNVYLGGQIWVGGSVRSDSGRVWKSIDGGANWVKANVQDQQISEFKVAANGDVFLAHVFGTTSDMSVTHDGTNWIALNIYSAGNPNGYGCFSVDVNKRGHVFGTTESAQVRRSTDGGATFTSSTNLPGGNVQLVRISPHDHIFINGPAPFGTPPLYYSDSANNGTTFTQSANFPINKSITDIAFDNRDSMYVGTQNGLYTTSLPFNPTTSVFSLNASNGPGSITSFAKDKCGYLYTTTFFSGISKSAVPVDVPNGCGLILPLQISSFEAAYISNDNKVKIDWATTSEKNIRYFHVEKSSNGTAFTSIGTIAPAALSSFSAAYTFTDNNLKPGLQYYRIKQVDDDGNFSYSKIIPISILKLSPFFISLYPNPVGESIKINFSKHSNAVQVTIFNTAMQKLVETDRKLLPGEDACIVSLKDFGIGLYFLVVTDLETGEETMQRFVK